MSELTQEDIRFARDAFERDPLDLARAIPEDHRDQAERLLRAYLTSLTPDSTPPPEDDPRR